MSRLKKCASGTSSLNESVISQITSELNKLAKHFDDMADGYVDGFEGTIKIKCKEQYDEFNLLLNFNGDSVQITNEDGTTLDEMISTFEDANP